MTDPMPPARAAVRLSREATVGIVVATMLACGALGLIGEAAISRTLGASSPRFAEARFLPPVGPQVPTRDAEPGVELPTSYDISLGGSPPAADSPHVALMGGAVAVPLPSNWRAAAGDGVRWTLLNRDESVWVWVQTATTDAALVDSEDLLRASFEQAFVADSRVADVVASDVEALRPFGRVTSRSMLSYRGLYADPLFTSRFQSNLYAGVRNDGTVLLVEVRIYPGPSWDARVDSWYLALYEPLWESFAQAALLTDGAP